jgi:hypothetical protein
MIRIKSFLLTVCVAMAGFAQVVVAETKEEFAQRYIAAHNQAVAAGNVDSLLAISDSETLACWQGQDRELLAENLLAQVKDNPIPADAEVRFAPADRSMLINMVSRSSAMSYPAQPDFEMIVRFGSQSTDKCTGRAVYRAKNILHTIRQTGQGWSLTNACMTEQGRKQARANRLRSRQLEQNAAASYKGLAFKVKKDIRRVLLDEGRNEAARMVRQRTGLGSQQSQLIVDMFCRDEIQQADKKKP